MPHNYKARYYQDPLWDAVEDGFNRLVIVWHRRSGKDKTCLNIMAVKMLERVGNYFYVFPTYAQGKKALWNAIDKDGRKMMDHIPRELRRRTDNTQMFIELINGSTFQIIGSDNIDSIVGSNPVGLVFSEYSLQNPSAWDFTRPILAENGGWALFNFTPRGKNHAYRMYNYARKSIDWYAQVLKATETNSISEDVLRQEKEEIVAHYGDDALYRQEYLCDFNAPIMGSYYAALIERAEEEGRIAGIPYENEAPVHTAWDLGVGDSTAIWFYQTIGREIHLIDYYEASGEGLTHYIKVLKEKPYVYGTHYAPHDIKQREWSRDGKSRAEVARGLGIDFEVVPNMTIEDGIESVRNILGRCWFDETKCERGLDALRSYHKEYDEARQDFRKKPEHDWSSHGADAFRYLAVSYKKNTDVIDYDKLPTTYRPRRNL